MNVVGVVGAAGSCHCPAWRRRNASHRDGLRQHLVARWPEIAQDRRYRRSARSVCLKISSACRPFFSEAPWRLHEDFNKLVIMGFLRLATAPLEVVHP